MRRREFIALLGSVGIIWPLAVHAQQTGKIYRIGVLADAWWPAVEGLRQELQKLGYVEGENLRLEYRWAHGQAARYPTLAEELVRVGVDAIVTQATPAALGAQKATTTIPIVMASISDGGTDLVVPSLARPGGNITGFSSVARTLHVKRLELLKILLPKLSRVAVLLVLANPSNASSVADLRSAAETMGLTLAFVDMKSYDIDAALSALSQSRPDAVLVTADPALLTLRERITSFMAHHRLPAIYPVRDFAEVGGLIVYAADYHELFRRAAGYVDRILKGAKPGDLPIQQAEKFEMVINLKTAKALGLTVPDSLLARADEIIE